MVISLMTYCLSVMGSPFSRDACLLQAGVTRDSEINFVDKLRILY
jgi:hypothetical protein